MFELHVVHSENVERSIYVRDHKLMQNLKLEFWHYAECSTTVCSL